MENNEIQRNRMLKMNFFEQIWYSITKFEKYPEMAAIGLKRAMMYLTKLMLVFCIILTTTFVYYLYTSDDGMEVKTLSGKMYKVITTSSEYEEIADNLSMNEFKDSIENYSDGYTVFAIFIAVFIVVFIITFIRIILLSGFGLITCFFAQIKINYKAIFNMSIYAMTLSILLHIIYSCIMILTDFKVKYFDLLYISVSYISLAAAIFIIKSNVIKTHLELMKIIDSSKEKIEETIRINQERERNKNKETEDNKKEDEEDKENENDDNSSEDGINV